MHKVLLIEKISYFKIPIICLLRIRYDEIYYVDSVTSLLRSIVENILDIKPFSTKDIRDHEDKLYSKIFNWANFLEEKYYQKSFLSKALIQYFAIENENINKFHVAVMKSIYSDLFSTANFYVYRDELEKDLESDVDAFINGSPLFMKNHKELEKSSVNLFPEKLSLFFSISELMMVFTRKRLAKRKTSGNTKEVNTSPENEQPSSEMLDVAYFPHKGIFYGNMFVKDQYYMEDEGSPYHPSNILHLSLGDTEEELKETIDYYRKKKITYLDLHSLCNKGLLYFVKEYISILRNERFETLTSEFFNSGVSSFVFYQKIFYGLKRYLIALEKLHSLKVALLGYDILFPPLLAVALGLKNIKTIATQERLLLSLSEIFNVIVDNYFVVAEPAKINIENQKARFPCEKIEVLGPIRLDNIYNESEVLKLAPDQKYSKIKDKFFLILVMPFHLNIDPEMDRLTMAHNWETVRIFYEGIIKLAKNNENAYFAIKAKDLSMLQVVEFQSIVDEIENLSNMEIETDLDFYSPAKMVSICDAGIAMHTSMGDEMLAAGKPVIFYDFFGCPLPWYDYEGLPIIAKTEQELLELTGKMVKGCLLSSNEMQIVRRAIFGNNYDGKIKQRLHNKLMEIYSNLL